ncbi:MAG: zinc ABC transporter substrate-binding protein [Tissierellia bacterium]|nr:zinc ABC transporter substrate-binding protein [Tissierellia bacterium]
MKRNIGLLALLLISILILGACKGSAPNEAATTVEIDSSNTKENTITEGVEKATVYASIYPIYDFAKMIAGERVQVQQLLPMGADAHHWEPSPSDITKLEGARLLVLNGAGLETWAEDILAALDNPNLILVDASKGISLQAGHAHGEDEEAGEGHDEEADDHEHGQEGFDPHTWISPVLAKEQAKNIYQSLVDMDPEGKAIYSANYQELNRKLEQLDQKYRDTITALPHKDLVVSHAAFGYLASEYGLNQMAIEGLIPNSEPSLQQMAALIDYIRVHQIKAIFVEKTSHGKVAETIAAETGVKVLELSPVASLTPEEEQAGDDYFQIMEKNLQAIQEGLN